MDRRLLERAAKKVELRDIVLDTSSLARNPDFDPELYPRSVRHQTKISVTAQELTFSDAEDVEIPVLRTYVRFDLAGYPKVTKPHGEDASTIDPEPALFTVSAVYRVEYAIKKPLTPEEIEQFSEYNVVHNAWPFWRQHVSQLLGTAKLPTIVIPLFRRAAGQQRPKRSPRKTADRILASPSQNGK